MRRILIIRGHPDGEGGHYCDAIVEAYRAGAAAAGHSVDLIDIARLDLPYLRNEAAWLKPAPNEGVAAAQQKIAAAEHLVFVYPLWLGDMPALLKSFLEQVSTDGFVMALDKNGHWTQGLKGKSARIIVTMGMPALIYRFYFFAHSLRSFERNILKFAGAGPVRHTIIGSIDKGRAYRESWLAEIHDLGMRAG